MSQSLQYRVRRLDNARHHGGERGAGPAMIIWHATRSAWNAVQVIDYLNSTKERIASYTYLFDRDSLIYRMCRPEFVAWHAGDSAWPHPIPGNGTEECRPNGGRSVNAISLGFAFCLEDNEPMPAGMRESALWTAELYMRQHDIPPSLNLGHKEVSPNRKPDPVGLDMDAWRREIGAVFQ